MNRALALVVAATLCVGVAERAVAGETPRRTYPEQTADFWRDVRDPGFRRSRTLMQHALTRLFEARTSRGASKRAFVEGAIVRLRRALRLTPNDPEILFWLARATSWWEDVEPSGEVRRLDADAVEIFGRLRQLDAAYEAEDVAFELGVLHTRLHDFEAAAEEYERAISLELMPRSTVMYYANLAEVTMLAGHVERAVQLYENAIELVPASGQSTVLPLWGLAVALDRLGEHRAAVERASEAIRAGGGTLQSLHDDGVFFEPAYELRYYEALGHSALAESAADAAERERELRAAIESWGLFLREGGSSSRWADIARERLRAAERAASESQPRAPGGRGSQRGIDD